jgi:hypothetical protein
MVSPTGKARVRKSSSWPKADIDSATVAVMGVGAIHGLAFRDLRSC